MAGLSLDSLTLDHLLVLGLFPAALAAVIATDLSWRMIPNLVILSLACGFALLAASGRVDDMPLRLLLAAGVLAGGFWLFVHDLVGAGDAKLAAALALWLDPSQLPAFALACGALGALLVVGVTLYARRGWSRMKIAQSLPYGVALAGAGLALFPSSSLMTALA
ncbi:prepilin peptidase [Xanthobacter sp. DSM 24535]|uniref:prepilin peptidase n=1 Tax=Roseixanthobacter psychrophilus TaxID=3119917 RepID=UPI00372915EA